MSTNLTQPLPPPNAPMVDPQTGLITPVWQRFFMKLWTVTGGDGGTGAVIPDTASFSEAMGDAADVPAPDWTAGLMSDPPDAPPDPLAALLLADPPDAAQASAYLNSLVLLGGAVALTSGATANVTSLSLMPGDWDVYANVGWSIGSGATATSCTAAINTTSAATPSPNNGSTVTTVGSFTSSAAPLIPTGFARINISVTTTVYLVTNATFSGGTVSAFGMLQARRR